ncbi:MAG: hypothetical protein LBH08_03300 [Puniceicoccales bacterium]|jgi:hypothetical protein|nr:hypothetical protein [Puniceicoccales bacterium]
MEKHIGEALAIIGQKMGFTNFTTNVLGMIHLSISNIGELFIDVQQPNIFLYLLNEFQVMNFELISTAYIFCEPKANYNFTTNPVLQGESALGFAIRIGEEYFTPIALEEAINQLIDMASRLKQFAKHL